MKQARKRDSTATRGAILASARRAFATSGYDGAGVREIATKAGVTAMMVNHHYGSKELLFEAVVANAMETPNIITSDVLGSNDLAEHLAAALVRQTDNAATPLDGFLILLKSVANPRAAEICRKQIERYHHQQMTEALGGEEAAQRAAIALSLIAGFQLMRQMIKLTALGEGEQDKLVNILRSLFSLLFLNQDD